MLKKIGREGPTKWSPFKCFTILCTSPALSIETWPKRETSAPSTSYLCNYSYTFPTLKITMLAASNPTMRSFLEGKKHRIEEKLERAHVTLAHKRSHGVAAVARYGQHLNREVPVELTELLFNDKMAAFTAHVGSVDGETIVSKNEWPMSRCGLQKALLQRGQRFASALRRRKGKPHGAESSRENPTSPKPLRLSDSLGFEKTRLLPWTLMRGGMLTSRRRVLSPSPSPKASKFSVYRNPALAAASTANSIRPSKSVLHIRPLNRFSFLSPLHGRNRKEFESELIDRFGSLVKMPLLRSERSPLPDSVKSIIEEGIDLFQLHSRRHGSYSFGLVVCDLFCFPSNFLFVVDLSPQKGPMQRSGLNGRNSCQYFSFKFEYLNSIQVPFESAVQHVREELKRIAKGEYKPPSSEKTKHGSIVFAAINLPVTQVHSLLEKVANMIHKLKFGRIKPNNEIVSRREEAPHRGKLERAHVTLAHKRSHGVAAVARYGQHLNREVPVELTELLFNDKMAAFTAHVGSVDGETIVSKSEWPHVTLWTAEGVTAKRPTLCLSFTQTARLAA
ncbi:hypothetical protein Bca52824_079436 [Brassica carinata]|uniref:Uncharacterized protein n=1 Tax=Brassica carinata TaxID=52824 RepID=A0A8X7Q096_BRACI|nr:hypothetical protein Bca52824_079436 [Brassica carinata]